MKVFLLVPLSSQSMGYAEGFLIMTHLITCHDSFDKINVYLKISRKGWWVCHIYCVHPFSIAERFVLVSYQCQNTQMIWINYIEIHLIYNARLLVLGHCISSQAIVLCQALLGFHQRSSFQESCPRWVGLYRHNFECTLPRKIPENHYAYFWPSATTLPNHLCNRRTWNAGQVQSGKSGLLRALCGIPGRIRLFNWLTFYL